jgi:hypothetical protein
MFKFFCAPFDTEVQRVIEKFTPRTCHAAIVWESPKGARLITASSAASRERQQYKNEKMQHWLVSLNSGKFREISRTLRTIYVENTPKPKPKPFFHSFKGHGGSGVEGYW